LEWESEQEIIYREKGKERGFICGDGPFLKTGPRAVFYAEANRSNMYL
jgi:hypothetical protein